MATTYTTAGIGKGMKTSEDAGQLTLNIWVLDLANTAQRPATNVINDLILIGVIPGGEKLVPHLSQIVVPQLDSNGTPLGDFSIGILATPAALVASSAAETAIVVSGEDFPQATSEVGNRYDDVPIYLKLVSAIATLAPTGKIICRLASRPWDTTIDGNGPT